MLETRVAGGCIGAISGRRRQNAANVGPTFDQVWSKSGRCCPELAQEGLIWSKLGETLAQTCSTSGPNWSTYAAGVRKLLPHGLSSRMFRVLSELLSSGPLYGVSCPASFAHFFSTHAARRGSLFSAFVEGRYSGGLLLVFGGTKHSTMTPKIPPNGPWTDATDIPQTDSEQLLPGARSWLFPRVGRQLRQNIGQSSACSWGNFFRFILEYFRGACLGTGEQCWGSV